MRTHAILHALSTTASMTWAITWDYTTWLNIVFGVIAAALVVRFVRTGGVAMLRMMGGPPDSHEHDHMDSHASHRD